MKKDILGSLNPQEVYILGEKPFFGGLIFSSYNENIVLENMCLQTLLCSVISCLASEEFGIQS